MTVRPAVRRVAIVAFVILLPIAAHSLWDYVEVRRLANEIEKIRAKGEPVTEREATGGDPPPPAVERSAADYYLAGAMLALGTNPFDITNPIREWLAAPTPDRAALPQLLKPLQDVVDANADAVALADRAAPLPFTGLTAGTEYSYRIASLSALGALNGARTLRLSLAGNGDAAVDSVISGLRLRRALSDGRGFLRGDNVDAVLSLTRPSAESLRKLDAALAEVDRPDLAHQLFLRQRARYIEAIWRQTYGPDPAAPRHYTLPARTVLEMIWRPWSSHLMVDLLRTWADLDEVSKRPWPEKIAAGAKLRQTLSPPNYLQGRRVGNVFVYRGVPFDVFLQSVDAAPLVLDRTARIAVAIERFRLDRHELPTALADLVPNYLKAIPEDPYSGQPLLYVHTGEAYTIYSVGPNLKDDAGDLTSKVSEGGRNARVRGTDIGVRVLTQR